MAAAPRPLDLSARLDVEWEAMRRDPAVLAHVRLWGVAGPLDDLEQLLAVLGHRVSTSASDNERLRVVVGLAHEDEVAARIVLQRILPGLLARVRERGRARRDGVFEELIGAAWISIRTTRHGPSCTHLAAALVSDAVHRTFVAPRRRRAASEVVCEPTMFDDTPCAASTTAFEELAEVVAEARRAGLADEDVALLRDLVRTGSAGAVAAERHVTARTIRNHRARIAYQIRRSTAA